MSLEALQNTEDKCHSANMHALYFPNLSLPTSTWVNPALLYFDSIGVIAPFNGGHHLHDARTEALIESGLVQTVSPFLHPWDEAADDWFLGYLVALQRTPPKMQRLDPSGSLHRRIENGRRQLAAGQAEWRLEASPGD